MIDTANKTNIKESLKYIRTINEYFTFAIAATYDLVISTQKTYIIFYFILAK